MRRRGSWYTFGRALCAGAVLAGMGCASSDDAGASLSPATPGDYMLGGQTGSLVPGCGVAPLSAEGRSVPAGDAVAVLYARDCPEEVAALQLVLEGQSTPAVGLELVPLDRSGVFLVRANQSLAGGEYRLAVGDEMPSDVRVSEQPADLPQRLGQLRLLPEEVACGEQLRFALELDDAALAHAPLLRLEVRIDRSRPQLWVDYGALPIEGGGANGRSVLELPRCTPSGCLEAGGHSLELSARIAGESIQPEPIELAFEVTCVAASAAASDAGGSTPGASCALSSAPRRAAVAPLGLVALLWFWLRRRANRHLGPRRT